MQAKASNADFVSILDGGGNTIARQHGGSRWQG
jgi:hypothetical protein